MFVNLFSTNMSMDIKKCFSHISAIVFLLARCTLVFIIKIVIELSLLFIYIFEEYIVRHSLRLTKLEKI